MLAAMVLGGAFSAPAWEDADAKAWVDRFAFAPPPVGEMPMDGQAGRLPVVRRAEFPAEGELVRMALPFPPGALPQGKGLLANLGDVTVPADVRVLTVHPDAAHSVRRAIVTFPMERLAPDYFSPVITFRLGDTPPLAPPARQEGAFAGELGEYRLEVDAKGVTLKKNGTQCWNAVAVAPPLVNAPLLTAPRGTTTEVVEQGRFFLWVRVLVPDPQWPRILEAQLDRQGRVRLTLHVQRCAPGDDYAPELGWKLDGAPEPAAGSLPPAERLPMQSAAWRSATTTVTQSDSAQFLFGTKIRFADEDAAFTVTPGVFDALYHCGVPPVLDRPFEEARQQHQNAMAAGTLTNPEDRGNVTSMPSAGVFGMNRLNHCPAIFDEYHRSGRADIRRVALDWCDNFYNLSVWWGTDRKDEFGGTRYNNNVANGDKTHEGDQSFMWRSNTAVHFCTKGYDSFFHAYEETGDPRYAAALRWQTEYASRMIHTNQGECRNIGDVLDFVRLYEFTGHRPWLDEALRLFRELREKLGPDGLFSQGGQPIEPDLTFMDNDSLGYKHPFAKPYIIGYALQGLPELARHAPEEPRLAEVIRAVAKFLVESQDPAGGWRYPHPRSSTLLLDQAMEHAMQLSRAAVFLEVQGDDINPILDAVERTLRARMLGLQKTGAFLCGLQGWEKAAGVLKDGKDIHDLYEKPTDRDGTRDYAEGLVSAGASSPEAVVYFSEVLDFYAKHRDPKRLLEAGPELQLLLDRVKPVQLAALALRPELLPSAPSAEYAPYGLEKGLPSFAAPRADAIARNHFTGAGDPAAFAAWQRQGRAKLIASLQEAPRPPADTAYATLGEEDRGAYVARKIVFSPSAEYRVPAYLLVPKGRGPFPAVIALHDHGAHFSIGKEKVVRPFGVDGAVERDAREWVDKYYGGRFLGDALAEKGYVVLAIDALFWGERGRKEGVEYEAQQQLAANLLQLGMTWLGVISWDDVRSAEFLACQPEVDPGRIGAVGLSMGSHRTWMLNALSDRVAAGAAICWMGTTDVMMAPGNNQTRGQSAFAMMAPGLRRWLDYPAVAALAAPKPMLFYNGDQDALFPVEGVEKAWYIMRDAWKEAGAGDKLETRMWPVPHEFNREMQDAAFAWLERQLKPSAPQ
jgi:dienelactone hydrolase